MMTAPPNANLISTASRCGGTPKPVSPVLTVSEIRHLSRFVRFIEKTERNAFRTARYNERRKTTNLER